MAFSGVALVSSTIPPRALRQIIGGGVDAVPALDDPIEPPLRKKLGVIDEILPEPLGGAHRDPAATATTVKRALLKHLGALGKLSTEELIASPGDEAPDALQDSWIHRNAVRELVEPEITERPLAPLRVVKVFL